MESDIDIAIDIATKRRDEEIKEFTELLKTYKKEDSEKAKNTVDAIIVMNGSIKLLEDALIAVIAYKRNHK